MDENKKQTTEESSKPKPRRILFLPFLLVLALLTVVAFIIPLRPTQSVSEKRKLTEFPEFSVSALLSGDYFNGIHLWFSDTFPFRESWISLSGKIDRLHGSNEITIYGDLPPANTVPPVQSVPSPQPTPEAEVTPPVESTVPEEPVAPPEEVLTLPPEESVEQWGGIEVDEDAEVIFGSVLQIGDSAFAYYGFSQPGADRYVKMINNCAQYLSEKDIKVHSMLVPTSVGVMVASEYLEMLGCADQGEAISYMLYGMDERINKVNVFNTLIDHNDEYIYFRTDHHWSALGAYHAYAEFCKSTGMEAAPLESFELMEQGNFKGSFYYSCNQSSKLRIDTVDAYKPQGDLEMKITAVEGNTFPWEVITDMSHSTDNAKYMAFLAGDHPMTVISNHDLPDAPSCVVIKDSFGNAMIPFLTQNYHKIYALDYRSYFTMKLRYFVEAYEVDEVIFLNSLALSQGDGTLNLLESLTR